MTVPEIISAVPTPFDTEGEIDFPALQKNLRRLEPLVDGVFAAGTTGEFPGLSDDERLAVIREALAIFGPDRVVAHVGAATARQATRLAKAAAQDGAKRFAAITPYFLTASPAAVADYYKALRQAVPKGELYGYFFPEVAGTDVAPEDLNNLIAVGGLDGIKVSGGASARVSQYLAEAPEGFKLWSGNDADLPNILASGGRGTVSGVSAVSPEPWAVFRAAYAEGNEAKQAEAQKAIELLVPVLGPSIANLKYGIGVRGLDGGSTRMSIDAPTPATQDLIKQVIADAEEVLNS
jgi:dihydrodipicolinate synthase/N-acetylneuraminate lyase